MTEHSIPTKREVYEEWAIALAIFIVASVGSWLLAATALFQGIDEGIYLEGAEKLLAGQIPYRDFFAFTGPLIYITQAAIHALFGPNLAAARWPVAFALGAVAASGYVIARRFVARDLALGVAVVELIPHYLFYFRFHIGHRLSSMALLSMSGACLMAPGSSSAMRVLVAGIFAALAAWATPSFVVPLALIGLWLLIQERQKFLYWVGGVILCSLPFLLWLGLNGALAPMLDNLVWTTNRYSQANAVPYGYLIITYPTAQEMLYYLIPVFLPLTLAFAAYAIFQRKQRDIVFLSVFAIGFALTLYPRWDVLQLCYVLCPFVVLAGILAHRLFPETVRKALFAALLAFATFRFSRKFEHINSLVPFETRIGPQRAKVEDIQAVAKLQEAIPPDSTLFVFPYLPFMGYLLRTHNPISYPFMQPGMMSSRDEERVHQELIDKKPKFILKQYFSEVEILTVWPNSDREKLRFPSIEQFIEQNYDFLEEVTGSQFQLRVYRLRQ